MDVDRVFKQAIDAGARMTMPVSDMFWGNRFGQVTDPFGYSWSLATHKEDLPPEELQKRAKAAMAKMAQATVSDPIHEEKSNLPVVAKRTNCGKNHVMKYDD